jgi:hypothetical protein
MSGKPTPYLIINPVTGQRSRSANADDITAWAQTVANREGVHVAVWMRCGIDWTAPRVDQRDPHCP